MNATPLPTLDTPPRLLALDVDGVLTNNLVFLDGSELELKAFHIPDGTALKWVLDAGLEVALISGRRSSVVDRRAREIGIGHAFSGVHDKLACLQSLAAEIDCSLAEVVYAGDDFIDLPVFHEVGYAIAVANAQPVVKAAAHGITSNSGGEGAVREICEWILQGIGAWEAIVERYTQS